MIIELEDINGNTYKMENRIILFFLILICLSCSPSKNISSSDNLKEETSSAQNIVTNNTSLEINGDSILVYSCNDVIYKVKYKDHSRAYFPVKLRRCLMEKGFNGDTKANNTLVKLIELVGYDNFLMFGNNSKFRGRETFAVLLNIADDHTPTFTFDGEISDHTRSMGIMSKCYNMIDNINGLNVSEYVDKYGGLSYEEKLDAAAESPKTTMSKVFHETIKKAWKERKIKLKPYGKD